MPGRWDLIGTRRGLLASPEVVTVLAVVLPHVLVPGVQVSRGAAGACELCSELEYVYCNHGA